MPNANECELSRVFVRNVGGLVSEESIKDDVRFDVVLEAESGQTLFNGGGAYKLLMVLRDLTTSTTLSQQSLSGTFGDANWPTPVLQLAFTQNPAGGAADDHVLQVLGVLSAGRADPIVDAEESDIFIITQP